MSRAFAFRSWVHRRAKLEWWTSPRTRPAGRPRPAARSDSGSNSAKKRQEGSSYRGVGRGSTGPRLRDELVKLTERNHPEAGRRWPRSVFGVGTEPDPRFTFANERTFLAWICTALALLAAGISLDTFVTKFPEALRTAVSILLVLTGAACGGLAYRRWMASERALRLNKPLPAPIIAPVLGYGVVLVGVSFAVVLLVRR